MVGQKDAPDSPRCEGIDKGLPTPAYAKLSRRHRRNVGTFDSHHQQLMVTGQEDNNRTSLYLAFFGVVARFNKTAIRRLCHQHLTGPNAHEGNRPTGHSYLRAHSRKSPPHLPRERNAKRTSTGSHQSPLHSLPTHRRHWDDHVHY